MLLNNLMEGDAITTNKFISTIKNLNSEGAEHGTIKALLKNFIAPEYEKMAIKDNENEKKLPAVPFKNSLATRNDRMKSINDAKHAFLNSTIYHSTYKSNMDPGKETTLHYAQIAITTESEDTRSTGGGKNYALIDIDKHKANSLPLDIVQNIKKKSDNQHQRKVSFKIKNASTSHRRPPIATKTMTVTSTKVSELTKKFNDLVIESHNGVIKQSKLAKTIESQLQSASRKSGSNSSTPTSTLSSSPNIKIVVRQRRSSKKRHNRKRCSSMDSIEKFTLSENSLAKIRVIRSKSDGTKIPKSPKKRVKNSSLHEPNSGSDSVDGSPKKAPEVPPKVKKTVETLQVKNVIKKFENEIIAHTSGNDTLKRQPVNKTSVTPVKEKPKVPVKKSTLVLTKNLVVKDGIPKIRIIKSTSIDIPPKAESNVDNKDLEVCTKKIVFNDKKKYKTNYIFPVKLPLQVVDIIHEEASVNLECNCIEEIDKKETATDNKDLVTTSVAPMTPNESFLWRRKSQQIYSDEDKWVSDNPYSCVQITNDEVKLISPENTLIIDVNDNALTNTNNDKAADTTEPKNDPNSDFESNLVEAYNKEVLKGFTSKPNKPVVLENDYEPLEPRDQENVVIIPVRSLECSSIINCPLPEIPKTETSVETSSSKMATKDNIYQCLLEMRSHPEGDESSLHNYELCDSQMEERTRGDGDSDDGYEYCKTSIKPYCLTSSSGIQIAENYDPCAPNNNMTNYNITKSDSGGSTESYEKIGSDRIYEKIPNVSLKSKSNSPDYSKRHSFVSSDYTTFNDSENIYDTIKQSDKTSLSHWYESIPNSPSTVKCRSNMRKQVATNAQKRLSFDTVSNVSHSTVSSEQKSNSIYGQRSVLNYNGQEVAFQVPSSDTSVSDRSDRSDDWVDVSDEEKNDEQKIIIVHERSRGMKSPVNWSQMVRHQWQKSPKQKNDDHVFITSPSNVYIDTSAKSTHYSRNDEEADRVQKKTEVEDKNQLKAFEQKCWLSIRTILKYGEFEIQDLIAFIECDSSDSGHLYESLEPAPAPPPALPSPANPALPAGYIDDDFDSFDSDTDYEDSEQSTNIESAPPLPTSRLPSPPSTGSYTLTKFASAAQKKMRQLKRNITKRYSEAMDGKPFIKTSPAQNGTYEKPSPKSPIYANCEKPDIQHIYGNINFKDTQTVLNNTDTPTVKVNGCFKEELKSVITEKENRRVFNGDVPPPLPEKPPPEIPVTPTCDGKKDSGTLSRKAYFSFKSRFRRASSLAVDMNDVPGALKITNSTFYLTDSMDGDSGFSNCSESATSEPGALAPSRRGRRWADSSPCLALERPPGPPPPPPPPLALPSAHPAPPAQPRTDLSAVNEELKRLLPTLSRKDKGPRTRTSWYAECGADGISTTTSNTSWYAESGVYQGGDVSSSSGASSGSHPASPLPTSLFTHEPLYQFYNAAKVESVCREGDSDSDAYEASPAASVPPPAARPSAMALVSPRGPARTLWCEVPEVLNSAVLSSLAPNQKRLQEAKFELLTSEASYLNSLNVLDAHFISHPAFRDPQVLPPDDWKTLFATIIPVRKCSQQLMIRLEACWQEDILLANICELVREHADLHFHHYVAYCENQGLMVKTLQRLREQPNFAATLKKLESSPACQSLSLHSFVMLPMQRVTRLPLLLDAVLRNLHPSEPQYQPCLRALTTLNHFVLACNEGARVSERVEEMFRLARCVTFPRHVRDPPTLYPASGRRERRPVRWLVRSGEMTHLVWKADEMKLTFGRKFQKTPLYVFLFNDHLVITKKKGAESYVCVEHCPRSLLEVSAGHVARHALLLTLLENHQGQTIEMLMSCPNETELSRWTEALSRPESGSGSGAGQEAGEAGEAVYAGWDCPQVLALYAYQPAQPDELALHEGDVVNVTRKTPEGWYYGERQRDGEAGWFPGAYSQEIASPHVRARNLRQRYRLLALSRTYRGNKK